jgi:hypothetical protein
MQHANCAAVLLAAASPVLAQHQGHDMGGMTMPSPAQRQGPPTPPPMEGMSQPEPQSIDEGAIVGEFVPRRGALGSARITREASGTSWQPDATPMTGLHLMTGDWMLMGHVLIDGVYDRQSGPRGGDRTFLSGMVMAMARRERGAGILQLRAMLSPEPLMGARGYPLLLASGETADGAAPLVDRQHPHDLFMELSASYSVQLAGPVSAFVYAGLPGEPAFGPPAFMHRLSIMDSPEAPISHHWLDSTHVSFGVVTAGLVVGNLKLEGSRFNGREPDQHRWDIETGPLDSTALRLSWNPGPNLALQASWARLVGPEELAPGLNSTRWSLSAIYTRPIGSAGWWSTTLAWGNRDGDDALALESAAGLGLWTLFGRAEYARNDELTGAHPGPAYDVGKVSLGAIRDVRIAPHFRVGLGGLYAFDFVPDALRAAYGGNPRGAMAFIRLKVD